jgi:hypothetical protein
MPTPKNNVEVQCKQLVLEWWGKIFKLTAKNIRKTNTRPRPRPNNNVDISVIESVMPMTEKVVQWSAVVDVDCYRVESFFCLIPGLFLCSRE